MEDTVLERIKYTQLGVVTAGLIASMFDLDEVVIGDAIENTADETAAGTEFTGRNVWEQTAGKGSAFLYYKEPVSLSYLGAGVQARVPFLGGQLRRVTSWREEAEHQDVYEVAEQTQVIQTVQYAARAFKDTILS